MTARGAAPFHAETPFVSSTGPCQAGFVGRARELASLEAMLVRAIAGSGGIAILAGEAGMGKTRTAEEFADSARKRGVPVYWGRCWEGEECPPLGPWAEALAELIRANEAVTLRSAMGETAEDIAAILPEFQARLGAPAAPPLLDPMDGAQRLSGSILRFLSSASQRAPLMIVIDNLHLADEMSLRFLRHSGPELARSRLLVVGTCRTPAEVPREALALTLQELSKSRGFLRLFLEGLAREEVRMLVGGAFPGRASLDVSDRIHARTGGNPLFVVEFLRQARSFPAADIGGGTLPEGIRQVIDRRLRRLSGACRCLLATAAVLGQAFDRETLAPPAPPGPAPQRAHAAVTSAGEPCSCL